MNDLDSLKSLLQNKLEGDIAPKNIDELNQFIRQNTQSVLGKIKKGFVFEIAFGVLLILALLYYCLVGEMHFLKIYFAVLIIVSIAMIAIIGLLYQKIDTLGKTALPVKANLIAIKYILEQYIKKYLQITLLAIPVFTLLAAALGYKEGQKGSVAFLDDILSIFPNFNWMGVFAIAYIILLTIITYYFTKWFLHRLYGKYIQELDNLINELDEL